MIPRPGNATDEVLFLYTVLLGDGDYRLDYHRTPCRHVCVVGSLEDSLIEQLRI